MTLSNLRHCSGTKLMTGRHGKLLKKGCGDEPTDLHGHFRLSSFEICFSLSNNSSNPGSQLCNPPPVMWTSWLFCCAWTGKTDLILHYFRNLPFQMFHLLSAFFTTTFPHPASVVQDNFMLLFCKILELTIIFWVCCKLWNSLYLWIKKYVLIAKLSILGFKSKTHQKQTYDYSSPAATKGALLWASKLLIFFSL